MLSQSYIYILQYFHVRLGHGNNFITVSYSHSFVREQFQCKLLFNLTVIIYIFSFFIVTLFRHVLDVELIIIFLIYTHRYGITVSSPPILTIVFYIFL